MESVEDQIDEQLREANYDEDEDEDFVPEDDDEPEIPTEAPTATKTKPQIKKRKRATLEDLDGVKRRKVDDDEEENEAELKEETPKTVVNSAVDHLFASMQSSAAPKKKKKKKSSMGDIFAQFNNPKKSKKQAPKKKAPKIATVSDLWSTLESKDAKDKLAEDAKKMKNALKTKEDDTEIITETYEFAGQTVTREKRVKKQSGGENDSTLPMKTQKKSALASVLKGVNKVNSMAKSAMDWDQFKEKENLEEELAKNRQDGYLKKQQFLIEADHADLDRERVVRDINRRRRDANRPKK